MGRAGIEPATLGLKVPDNKIGQDRTQPTQQGSSQREQWLSALNQGNDEELSVPAVTPNPYPHPYPHLLKHQQVPKPLTGEGANHAPTRTNPHRPQHQYRAHPHPPRAIERPWLGPHARKHPTRNRPGARSYRPPRNTPRCCLSAQPPPTRPVLQPGGL